MNTNKGRNSKKKKTRVKISIENKHNVKKQKERVPFAKIKKICEKCPVLRTKEELTTIHNLLSSTELKVDYLWRRLDHHSQLLLCSYFKFQNSVCKEKVYTDSSAPNICIFMNGVAQYNIGSTVVSLPEDEGILLHNILVPQSVKKLLSNTTPHTNEYKEEEDTNTFLHSIQTKLRNQLGKPLNAENRPNVIFHPRSHYLYLNKMDLRIFMESLFEDLVTSRVTTHLDISKIDLTLMTFAKGTIVYEEDIDSDKIIMIIRGKCSIQKCPRSISDNEYEVEECQSGRRHGKITIGSAAPLTFLGFLPHFTANKSFYNVKFVQPYTVTALDACGVRCLVIDARLFLQEVQKRSHVNQCFREAAMKQTRWLNRYLPFRMELEVIENEEKDIEPFPDMSMSMLEEAISSIFQRKVRKPRWKKQKMLSALNNLLGVSDPSSNDEEGHEYPYSDLNQIIQYDRSTDDCEGKNGDKIDDDDFLQPCPSLVERKFHGKTLPIIHRIRSTNK